MRLIKWCLSLLFVVSLVFTPASMAATYEEIIEIYNNEVGGAGHDLYEKVKVACFIAANTIVTNNDVGGPWDPVGHPQRLKWVDSLLANPDQIARQVYAIVLAANSAATQTQILNATDSTIQTNVNASVDSLSTNIP